MWYDILVNSLLCAAAVFPLRKKPEKEQIIMSSIILASQSPRRQELIARITEDFEVIVAEEPTELPSDVQPEEAPVFLASYKAGSVAVNHRDRIVIGADTVVLVDDKVLGKPKDQADAERMLRLLSGRKHTVITGCCIICGSRWLSFSSETQVEFYDLSDREIAEYIATGEPFDKAGAYGIQGQGSLLVKGIEGDYFNVMGLPVARLKRELEHFTGE